MEEEKDGITLGEVFGMIFSRKFLALIIAVAITVIGTIGLYLIYSPRKLEYMSTFSINIPLNDDGRFEYPNGTTRSYIDFDSLENLAVIKGLTDEFDGIDVNKMSKRGDIGITRSGDATTGGITYTVNVNAKYFPNENVAADFINQIADTASRDIAEWLGNISHDMDEVFNEKVGNEQKVEYLENTIERTLTRFEKINVTYSALERLRSVQDALSICKNELHINFYEPNINAINAYKARINELEIEINGKQAVIDSLTGNLDGEAAAVKAQYANEKYELEVARDRYKNYIDKNPDGAEESQASKDFTNSLNGILSNIKSLITRYELNYYTSNNIVSYSGAPVRVTGGVSLLTSVVVSLIIGLIVAAIAAFIVAWHGNKKKTAEALSKDGGQSEQKEEEKE